MQILTANHWTEVRDPYGRLRRAEGDGNPIGRPTVSTNWTPGSSQRVNRQPKIINGLVRAIQHMCSKGLPCWPS
ncbi:mCG1048826 [Mus musculus]|nr:mCG1048826 [Mus musculus]